MLWFVMILSVSACCTRATQCEQINEWEKALAKLIPELEAAKLRLGDPHHETLLWHVSDMREEAGALRFVVQWLQRSCAKREAFENGWFEASAARMRNLKQMEQNVQTR
jgi:hypothetical protein